MKKKLFVFVIGLCLSLLACSKSTAENRPTQPTGEPFVVAATEEKEEVLMAEAQQPGDLIVLRNGTLIDGSGAQPRQSVTIVITGKIISQIVDDPDFSPPEGARIYDLQGATVLPGFINAHVHRAYSATNLKNWLAGGVTTVRDLGPLGVRDFLTARDEFNADPHTTRIVSGNNILSPPGGYDGSEYYGSAEEAREKVLNYAALGVDVIKFSIEDNLQGRTWVLPTFEEVQAIVDAAHSQGKKVAVHLMHARNLQWAVEAGVDDVAHMVAEPVDDDIIRQMVEKDIYWVPTLELMQGISRIHRLNWDTVALENLAKFYAAGGKVALGTDFGGYICPFDSGFPETEVLLMQKAGMTNMDIIVAGTRNAAFVCDLADEIGTLEVGKTADILVVKDDPLAKLEALFNPWLVIHEGVIVKE